MLRMSSECRGARPIQPMPGGWPNACGMGCGKPVLFRPPASGDVREVTRSRTTFVQERRREINRVPGVLERAYIKLAVVATDMMGVSGRALLAAWVEGQGNSATMAELATRRRRSKIPLLEQALTGLVREHHRRLLAIQLAHIDFLDEHIEALSRDITRCPTELSAEAVLPPPSTYSATTDRAAEPAVPDAPLT
jgi:transposase